MADKDKLWVPDPGVCVPWKVKLEETGDLPGNEEIVKTGWEKLDEFAYNFIWFWPQR